jgi:hypothetical protein
MAAYREQRHGSRDSERTGWRVQASLYGGQERAVAVDEAVARRNFLTRRRYATSSSDAVCWIKIFSVGTQDGFYSSTIMSSSTVSDFIPSIPLSAGLTC